MPITNNKVDAYARALASQAIDNTSNSSTTFISSGTVIKPTITYNTGLGTVTIGDGTYRLFHNAEYIGVITEHIISETTLSIAENITSYICADYNNDSPILRVITDLTQFNWSNIVPIYTVIRDGDYFSHVDWDAPGNGLPNKIHDRLIRTDRFSRESGLNLGESATPVVRTIIVSSGTVWQGVYRNSMDAVDSSVDICKMLYTDETGTWVDSAITQYNNTQYNTGMGLATLTDGNYSVNWIFRMIGNQREIIVFLGNDDYDLNVAKASQLPNNIPSIFSKNGMLIGRIIVLKGADIATQIDSAFDTKFAPSIVTSHEGLTSLEGGNATHHYHSDQPINTTNDVEFNSISIGSTASITGNTTVGGDLDITGNSDLNGTLDVIGNTTISGTLDITGATTLNSTETVNGLATFKDNIKQATTKEHRFYNSGDTLYTSIDSPLVDGNDYPDFRVRTQAGTFYVDKDGKFGNTSNPTKDLHVVGDGVITGDLDVQGTLTYIDVSNLNVEDKNIYLLNVTTPTDTLADGGGIVLNGTTDKTILWDQSTGNWKLNTGLTIDSILQSVAGDSLTLNGTSTSINMQVAGTTKATLTNTGLGINQSNPSEMLEINDNVASTSAFIKINGATNAGIKLVDGIENDVWLYKLGNGAFRITTTVDSGTTQRIRLQCEPTFSAICSPNGVRYFSVFDTESIFNVSIRPSSNNTYDLGTSSHKMKNGYFAGHIYNDGFTKLGSDAPAIKMRKYTGTMPALGQHLYIAHGLTQSKIINFSSVVTDSSGTLRLPNVTASTDIEYYFRIKSDGTIWLTTGASGTLIVGRPVTVSIIYEE